MRNNLFVEVVLVMNDLFLVVRGEKNSLSSCDDLPKMLGCLNGFSSDPESFLPYITDFSL